MDLLTCLPTTKDGYDTIAVFVDRLTKFCVAVPTKLTVDAPGFARLLVDHVISKFGMPVASSQTGMSGSPVPATGP